MKPTHKVFCKDCGRSKMLFETEKKALRFIEFNADSIVEEGGKRPKRVYYCPYCMGYHITSSSQYREGVTATNNILEAYENYKKKPLEVINNKVVEVELDNNGSSIIQTKDNILSPELKLERDKMRKLNQEIKGLLDYYTDKTNKHFIEALEIEQEVFNSINCDDIKAKTNVETILKQYLNND